MTTPDPPVAEESEPDYRFTLANERTYLAWQRTALGLIAGGVALAEFAQAALPSPVTSVLAVVAVLLGAGVASVGLQRWRGADTAMRRGLPLPRPTALPLLAIGLALIGVIIAVGLAVR